MENLEKFKALFPLEVEVTQEIIDSGTTNIGSPSDCIGALALRKGLGEKGLSLLNRIRWGTRSGVVKNLNYQLSFISSCDENGKSISMMKITERCKVTFKLDRQL